MRRVAGYGVAGQGAETIGEEALRRYLEGVLGGRVEGLVVSPLGDVGAAAGLKAFGYGVPLRLTCRVGGATRRFVLAWQRPGPGYGHDYPADRAQNLLWSHTAYNTLPRHARSHDVGFVAGSGALVSAGDAREFFLLEDFVEGHEYRLDLERIMRDGFLETRDLERVDALAGYLAGIHRERHDAPHLYHRRLRELVGHGECIMGILDGYPHPYPHLPPAECERIEAAAVAWRWRLRDRAHRLATVHGDFHPWNILFREGTDFTLLDRSRGEWGEPADDVAALTINYLFFALLKEGRLAGQFRILFDRFFERYLAESGDAELLEVLPPFYLFRGLVLGSPRWYPMLPDEVRQAIFRFVRRMALPGPFDPAAAGAYLEA